MSITSLSLSVDIDTLNSQISRTVPTLIPNINTYGYSSGRNLDQTVQHFQQMQGILNTTPGGLDQGSIDDLQLRITAILDRVQTARNNNSQPPLSLVDRASSSSLISSTQPILSPCASKQKPNPTPLTQKDMSQISPKGQGPNARYSSHYCTGPNLNQLSINRADPYVTTAIKWGLPVEALRQEHTASRKLYETSHLYATCGVDSFERKSLTQFFRSLGVINFPSLFKFSTDVANHTCTLEWQEEILGIATAPSQNEAQKMVEELALIALHSHPHYSEKFLHLLQVDANNPITCLFVLFQFYSIHQTGHEVTAVYPPTRIPNMSACRFRFRGTQLTSEPSTVAGNLSAARREQGRVVVNLFRESLNGLKFNVLFRNTYQKVYPNFLREIVMNHFTDVSGFAKPLVQIIIDYAVSDDGLALQVYNSRLQDQVLTAIDNALLAGEGSSNEKGYIRYLIKELPQEQFTAIILSVCNRASEAGKDVSSPIYGEKHLTDDLNALKDILLEVFND